MCRPYGDKLPWPLSCSPYYCRCLWSRNSVFFSYCPFYWGPFLLCARSLPSDSSMSTGVTTTTGSVATGPDQPGVFRKVPIAQEKRVGKRSWGIDGGHRSCSDDDLSIGRTSHRRSSWCLVDPPTIVRVFVRYTEGITNHFINVTLVWICAHRFGELFYENEKNWLSEELLLVKVLKCCMNVYISLS